MSYSLLDRYNADATEDKRAPVSIAPSAHKVARARAGIIGMPLGEYVGRLIIDAERKFDAEEGKAQ